MEHPQPVTMPGSGGATILDDLPDWIVVEEILVRLPPSDILRCRAVRKWWRSATSTNKFMLDHHRRQPLLPILNRTVDLRKPWEARLSFSFDAGAGRQQLCPVVRDYDKLVAARDGLLVVSQGDDFFICNPVTRECAPLGKPPSQQDFIHHIAGFYRHQPSEEYRVLWVSAPSNTEKPDYTTFYYVLSVGSDNTRCIAQCSEETTSLEIALCVGPDDSSSYPSVRHRGSLHWTLHVHDCCIMVFNIAAETFRVMGRPIQLRSHELLEMDGTLALYSVNHDQKIIDVWVIQDHGAETETWSLKHRINLSGVGSSSCSKVMSSPRMAVLYDGELLIQFTLRRVLHYDINGKFEGYVKGEDDQDIDLWMTKHYLQESIIPLPLLHEIGEEDCVSQEHPFFLGL